MDVIQKIAKICSESQGYRDNFTDPIPTIHQLLEFLYQNTQWNRTTPAELWSLLSSMQVYAFKNQIVDYYEMILRFTLSECFDEDHGRTIKTIH